MREWRAAQIPGQRRDVVGRQGAEKRLEDDFQFPEARAEIVVKRIHSFPRFICGEGISRELFDGLVKLAADAFYRSGKDSEFLEEAGAGAKKDDVEEAVPRGGILGAASAEVAGLEGFDGRGAGILPAVVGDRPAGADENVREAGEQIGGHHDLLAGADDFAAGAQAKGVAERDAHHGVRALPLLDDSIEELAFFTRERGKPVLRHPLARGAGAAPGE